jgi:hypothetical protein
MFIKSNSLLLCLSFLFLLFACEYERIADPANDCDVESLELTIESVQNTPCTEASGEIIVIVERDDNYEYRLNDNEFTESNVFTQLSAGTYTIQARVVDTNCISEEVEAIVNNIDGIQISLVEKSNSDCGESTGRILVSQEGGTEPIEYTLNNNQPQNNPEFTGLSSGSYAVSARDANGCETEIPAIDIKTDISFSNDIQPIIAANCAVSGCHNGTQSPNFTNDENIFENASRIKTRTGSGSMPPQGRPDLTDEEIQSIACWVDDGALDN